MHAEVVDVLRAALDSERENASVMRRQLGDLSARYHALRQQGYQPMPDRPTLERPVVDDVTKAVNEMSRGDRKLRAEMWQQVRKDRAAGIDDDTIAAAILQGQSSHTLEDFVA